MKSRTISVKGSEITLSRKEREDYISRTDIARYKNPQEPIARFRKITSVQTNIID
jgi:hypothetical protein